jgi:hypothetical protein
MLKKDIINRERAGESVQPLKGSGPKNFACNPSKEQRINLGCTCESTGARAQWK